MAKWVYQLTYMEEALAARIGYARQEPMLGQPWRNRNYSEGEFEHVWQHMLCAGSEIAAARMFGMDDFVPHVNTFKERIDIPGYEIRYSYTHKTGPKYALRFKDKLDDPNEIYVLIVGGPEFVTRRTEENDWKGPAYRAIGWMYGYECVQEKYKVSYGENNYSVPASEIHDMSTLPERVAVDA